MKKRIIGSLMKSISKNNNYSKDELEIIHYGLEAIYLLVTKLVIITAIAYLLGIFYEFVIFLLIYNIIRLPSFGLHATKSWICLVASTIMFIVCPIIATNIYFNPIIRSIIGCFCIWRIYKNAPADTEKRPIINKKRRLAYKYISTFTTIAMVIVSLISNDMFIANSFVLAPLLQTFMISPYVYKLFGLKYNNYLNYLNTSTVS